MAQNPWLEMFDKRMSELHQLDYLAKQMQDSQAARAQRGQEFDRTMQENILDRGIREKELTQRIEAQKNAEAMQKFNLLMGNAVKAQPGEEADITFGGEGFNAPSPTFNLLQKNMLEQQMEEEARSRQVEALKAYGKEARIPDYLLATPIADLIAGKNISSSWGPSEMYAIMSSVANDPEAPPERKKSALSFLQGMSRATRGGGSQYPPGHLNTARVNSIAGAMRAQIQAELGGLQPNTPEYRTKFASVIQKLQASPLFRPGSSPETNQAWNTVLGRSSDPRSNSVDPIKAVMAEMLLGGQFPMGNRPAAVPTETPAYSGVR